MVTIRQIRVGQLRAARAALALSQDDFARLLKISKASVVRWEAGAFDAIVPTHAEVLGQIEMRLRDAGVTFGIDADAFLIRVHVKRPHRPMTTKRARARR